MSATKVYNSCEKHINFEGELCPVCLIAERDELREKLEIAVDALIRTKNYVNNVTVPSRSAIDTVISCALAKLEAK